jgi:hypothetical protein
MSTACVALLSVTGRAALARVNHRTPSRGMRINGAVGQIASGDPVRGQAEVDSRAGIDLGGEAPHSG